MFCDGNEDGVSDGYLVDNIDDIVDVSIVGYEDGIVDWCRYGNDDGYLDGSSSVGKKDGLRTIGQFNL